MTIENEEFNEELNKAVDETFWEYESDTEPETSTSEETPEPVQESEPKDTPPQEEAQPAETEQQQPKQYKRNKVSAQKRIGQLTARNREFERQNKELQQKIAEIEKRLQPESKEKNIEDFDSIDEYTKHMAKKVLEEERLTQAKQYEKELNYRQEVESLAQTYEKNSEVARKLLPDFEEVIGYFDYNMVEDERIQKHLLGSKAGAFTMYELTSNEEVVDALSKARTQGEVDDIIIRVHDNIFANYDEYVAQLGRPTTQAKPQGTGVIPPAPKAVPRSTPPRQKQTSKTSSNLDDLDGEEFLELFKKEFDM